MWSETHGKHTTVSFWKLSPALWLNLQPKIVNEIEICKIWEKWTIVVKLFSVIFHPPLTFPLKNSSFSKQPQTRKPQAEVFALRFGTLSVIDEGLQLLVTYNSSLGFIGRFLFRSLEINSYLTGLPIYVPTCRDFIVPGKFCACLRHSGGAFIRKPRSICFIKEHDEGKANGSMIPSHDDQSLWHNAAAVSLSIVRNPACFARLFEFTRMNVIHSFREQIYTMFVCVSTKEMWELLGVLEEGVLTQIRDWHPKDATPWKRIMSRRGQNFVLGEIFDVFQRFRCSENISHTKCRAFSPELVKNWDFCEVWRRPVLDSLPITSLLTSVKSLAGKSQAPFHYCRMCYSTYEIVLSMAVFPFQLIWSQEKSPRRPFNFTSWKI